MSIKINYSNKAIKNKYSNLELFCGENYKINNLKKYNLDEKSLFFEFKKELLDG